MVSSVAGGTAVVADETIDVGAAAATDDDDDDDNVDDVDDDETAVSARA
jgi:hypothetical protein